MLLLIISDLIAFEMSEYSDRIEFSGNMKRLMQRLRIIRIYNYTTKIYRLVLAESDNRDY